MHPIHCQNDAYDLFSNFLTHSFFSLLEKCCLYELEDPKKDALIAMQLRQAIKSFLFILETSKNANSLLDEQIFQHYTHYKPLTKSQIICSIYKEHPESAYEMHLTKMHLSLKRVKKCYLQTVSHLKKEDAYSRIKRCNIAFIRLYWYIIYNHFPSFEQLPDIFKANCAEAFSKEIKHYLTLK